MHRFEEGSRNVSAPLKVSVSPAIYSICNWEKFGTTKTLLPSWSESSGSKGLSQRGDQAPEGHSDRAPVVKRGEPSRRTTTLDSNSTN